MSCVNKKELLPIFPNCASIFYCLTCRQTYKRIQRDALQLKNNCIFIFQIVTTNFNQAIFPQKRRCRQTDKKIHGGALLHQIIAISCSKLCLPVSISQSPRRAPPGTICLGNTDQPNICVPYNVPSFYILVGEHRYNKLQAGNKCDKPKVYNNRCPIQGILNYNSFYDAHVWIKIGI